MKHKIFTFFLALIASAGTLFAESGKCGENLTWDLTDGVLTISGRGAMDDFDWDSTPWYDYSLSITSVIIGEGVTSIGSYAFSGCDHLTSVTIPNSVTSIGNSTFYHCISLTSVTIPNSVTSIGNYAFSGCSGLTSVTIGNNVTSIGDYAFYECSRLTAVTIPNNVTSIGSYAFAYCSSLTSVTIPNSVTSIGFAAFRSCSSLTSITCEAAAPPTCGEDVFDGVDKSIPVYVPAGSVATYKAADQWKDFGDNIQPIQAPEANVTDLEANPTDNSVVIKWPAVTGATVYTINIYKGSDLICTLSFNELGQLLNISLAKKANGGNPKTAVQTATGWQYTIGGLEAGTAYSCTVIAKNGGETLYSKTRNFTTTNGTAVDQITNDKSQMANKIIKDNQLLIIRDGKTYSVQGAEVH